jgi:dihydrofolate reductase
MSSLPVAIVVAAADNDVIGRNNALPWDLPDDLRYFRRITMGKPVLMGRRTFESIGRPLPGRSNLVISRDRGYSADGVRVVAGLAEAIELAESIALIDGAGELMVIGGAQIYELAMPLATRLYLTRVHASPAGDTYLPSIDWDEWRETARDERAAMDGHAAHSFLVYTRRPEPGAAT